MLDCPDGIRNKPALDLMKTVATWTLDVHDEVWMFDAGNWSKSKELWENVQKTTWSDVILEEGLRESLIQDISGFFDAKRMYERLSVPWKRGLILYGPPGNGKTMSLRVIMHSLMERSKPIPTLYIKSFESPPFPQFAIRRAFVKARTLAPCLMLFEDVDSLVGEKVRSFFLNEVDGLENNTGILMIATTNHVENLDPALAKRPTRFDRKYVFNNPTEALRIENCEQWRQKVLSTNAVQFPESLCREIAAITSDFSFAYLKEAFLGTMIRFARENTEEWDQGVEQANENNPFWREMKTQVENLREEMNAKDEKDPKPHPIRVPSQQFVTALRC